MAAVVVKVAEEAAEMTTETIASKELEVKAAEAIKAAKITLRLHTSRSRQIWLKFHWLKSLIRNWKRRFLTISLNTVVIWMKSRMPFSNRISSTFSTSCKM
jgi:hypothetical protein